MTPAPARDYAVRALMATATALIETGTLAQDVLHGLAHRVAVTACHLGGVPASDLVEPVTRRARAVAGLPPVSADTDTAFRGIVEHLHLEEA